MVLPMIDAINKALVIAPSMLLNVGQKTEKQSGGEIGRDRDSKGPRVSNHCDLSFHSSGRNCSHPIII